MSKSQKMQVAENASWGRAVRAEVPTESLFSPVAPRCGPLSKSLIYQMVPTVPTGYYIKEDRVKRCIRGVIQYMCYIVIVRALQWGLWGPLENKGFFKWVPVAFSGYILGFAGFCDLLTQHTGETGAA